MQSLVLFLFGEYWQVCLSLHKSGYLEDQILLKKVESSLRKERKPHRDTAGETPNAIANLLMTLIEILSASPRSIWDT